MCLKRGSFSIPADAMVKAPSQTLNYCLVPKYTMMITMKTTKISRGRVVEKNCCFTCKFSDLFRRFSAFVSFFTGPFSCLGIT